MPKEGEDREGQEKGRENEESVRSRSVQQSVASPRHPLPPPAKAELPTSERGDECVCEEETHGSRRSRKRGREPGRRALDCRLSRAFLSSIAAFQPQVSEREEDDRRPSTRAKDVVGRPTLDGARTSEVQLGACRASYCLESLGELAAGLSARRGSRRQLSRTRLTPRSLLTTLVADEQARSRLFTRTTFIRPIDIHSVRRARSGRLIRRLLRLAQPSRLALAVRLARAGLEHGL